MSSSAGDYALSPKRFFNWGQFICRSPLTERRSLVELVDGLEPPT